MRSSHDQLAPDLDVIWDAANVALVNRVYYSMGRSFFREKRASRALDLNCQTVFDVMQWRVE
jgi:hypothetical protein